MTLQLVTVDLAYQAPNGAPLDGVYKVWLHGNGKLHDTATNVARGFENEILTETGVASVELPALPQDDIRPTDAQYVISFTPTDGLPVRTPPFQITEDKSFAELLEYVAQPVTPSLVGEALAMLQQAANGAIATRVWVQPESDPPPDGWQGVWFVTDPVTGDIVDWRTPDA